MKKIILVSVVSFVIGAVISPVAGMAINSTRSLILGMAPDEAILTLADKIDEESGRNDQQEQKLNNQEVAIERQERIRICENMEKGCSDKIEPIKARIENIKKNIPNEQEAITDYKKGVAQCNKDGSKGDACSANSNLALHKELLKNLQNNLAEKTAELNSLINGECKDYQNPCQ